jgi:eukaryotic-like serine/threonine-protein kinase
LGGKYRIDRLLGVGGMAVVFEATHRNNKQFAIKILHSHLSSSTDIRARFLREGYAANSLKHPGAVTVLDDDVANDGAPFLVMELLEGDELDRVLKKSGQRLPVRVVLTIGYQLLDVLAAAHAKGIVHRDVKPANLFLTRDGTVKVLDFGIARVREALHGVAEQTTHTGVLLGTPAFMSPEQAFAKPSEIDERTDVWSVGATLFTCLTGQFVHDAENGTQLMILAATKRAAPVRDMAPEIPASVATLLDHALAFEKVARWPSAEAMRNAIAETHFAMYGEAISKTALASLFLDASGPESNPIDTTGPTALSPEPRLRGSVPPDWPSSAVGTASKAVSRDTAFTPPRGSGRSGKRIAAIGAAVVGAALVVFGAFELGGRSRAVESVVVATAGPIPQPVPPAAPSSAVEATGHEPAKEATPVVAPIDTRADAAVETKPRATSAAKRTPCRFVTTLDKNGETHFSCPCASCQ